MNKLPKRIFALLLLLLLAFSPVISYGESSPTPVQGEKETVRVGYYISTGCMEGLEGEIKSGYAYEYLQKIAGYTGWDYEYVYGDFSELLDMLSNGEIDILPDVTYTRQRAEKILFPSEYEGLVSYYVVALSDNTKILSPTSIDGEKVGVLRGSYDEQALVNFIDDQELYCNVIKYGTVDEVFDALENKEISALVAPYDSIASAKVKSTKQVGTIGNPLPYYLAVSKKRPDVCEEIGNAMAMIKECNPGYFEDVYERYIREDLFFSAQELTAKERLWIVEHSFFKVGYLVDHLPFSDTDQSTGDFVGVFHDILDDLASRYNLQYSAKEYTYYADMVNDLHNGVIDIAVPSTGSLWYAEQNGVAVSDTFATTTIRAIFEDTFDPNNINSIAVFDKYAFQSQYSAEYYPDAKLIHCKNIRECLEKVKSGEADVCFFLETRYKMDSTITPELFYDLNTVKIDDHNVSLCFAVEKGHSYLLRLVNHEAGIIDENLVLNSSIIHSQYSQKMTLNSFLRENAMTATIVLVLFICLIVAVFIMFISVSNKHRNSLMAARELADRANSAKSRFLSQMSHDIRTPMNAIMGMTKLAKNEDNPPKTKEYLDKIDRSSQILLQLLNDILDSTAIEKGKLKIAHEPFSLENELLNIANVYTAQCKEKGIDFIFNIDDIKYPFLVGDSLRLCQIIINLISNSFKFTDKGGEIELKVLQSECEDKKVTNIFTVRDTGCGIEEDIVERIFEAFEQKDATTAHKHGGSGLGLNIVKNLVTMMGGTIEVESTPGVGTLFTVTLPFDINDSPIEECENDDNHIQGFGGAHILVADDDAFNRDVVTGILEMVGADVFCVTNGKEAYEAFLSADARYYSAILLDGHMPVMDGYEATKAIRASDKEGALDTPIFALTADAFAEDIERALQSGMTGHFAKPIVPETLIKTLYDYIF